MLTSRFNNLLLAGRCILKFMIMGKADKDNKDPKKVLIVQLAKLGDMVCTTPMFRAVKEKYHGAKLYVMGDLINKELLVNNADVDGYLVWDEKLSKTLKILRYEKFDFAVLTGPGPEALAVLYLSGIPTIIAPTLIGGYSPMNTKSYRLASRFVKTQPHYVGKYAPREYLRLLEPIGIYSENTKKYLSYSPYGKEKVLDFYKKNNIIIGSDFIVGIFPSTGYKIKLWGRDKFASVAEWLWKEYKAKIVLIGSSGDRKEVEEFLSYVPRKIELANAFNTFNVDELKAAISMMSLFISVDSGPIYIAEAFDIPTVDIVGPMNEEDQPPRGPKNIIVKAMRAKPAISVLDTRVVDEKDAKRQSEDISVEMVCEEIKKLIKILK